MTSIDLNYISFPVRLSALVQRAFRRFDGRMEAPESPEDARARRAFVQEMLSCNPGAFSSELDVQSMRQHYPAASGSPRRPTNRTGDSVGGRDDGRCRCRT
jgi:hypothetical protein